MKKAILRKSVTVILVVVIAFTLPITALAGKILRRVNDVALTPLTTFSAKSVWISRAILYPDGVTATPVYCVFCEGLNLLDFDPSHARSYTSAVKMGFSDENNAYVKEIVNVIERVVPHGANLVLYGRSLGGMAVQQAAAQTDLKRDYQILYTLGIGSPYIMTSQQKEGVVRRVVDQMDFVPYLSLVGLTNVYYGDVGVERSGVFPLVHVTGYMFGACWREYDCLGLKGGSAYIDILSPVYG